MAILYFVKQELTKNPVFHCCNILDINECPPYYRTQSIQASRGPNYKLIILIFNVLSIYYWSKYFNFIITSGGTAVSKYYEENNDKFIIEQGQLYKVVKTRDKRHD